jgi:hypothetical protein
VSGAWPSAGKNFVMGDSEGRGLPALPRTGISVDAGRFGGKDFRPLNVSYNEAFVTWQFRSVWSVVMTAHDGIIRSGLWQLQNAEYSSSGTPDRECHSVVMRQFHRLGGRGLVSVG